MSNMETATARPLHRHDFVETVSGLIFAVVESGAEDGRALCFLRYVRDGEGRSLRKLDTASAHVLLQARRPDVLFHSPTRDALLHGVPLNEIARHHRPREKTVELLATKARSTVGRKCAALIQRLGDYGVQAADVGVTGSILVGAESDRSDIDLVVYGAESFQRARSSIAAGWADGAFSQLSRKQWQDAYRRRGCALSLEEYIWHERRKSNKAVFAGAKFDIAQGDSRRVTEDDRADGASAATEKATKLRDATVTAQVMDDSAAFAFPARWGVDHPDIEEIAAFTPTYTGQAFAGETVAARGIVERFADGRTRLVVGTSREAPRQWIKVVAPAAATTPAGALARSAETRRSGPS